MGDRRPNQWQSEATSPARRHRACTRRRGRYISAGADHQNSSPRHQLPSDATTSRRNQRQSDALERTRARPSDAIRGHSGPIRRNRRSLRGHPEANPRQLPTKRHVRCCWLGNPIAISGASNVYVSNGWGGAIMYDAGSRLRWYMHPAAAGHSIALMREAIRRHESMHSKPASHSTACVRFHTGLCRRRPGVIRGNQR